MSKRRLAIAFAVLVLALVALACEEGGTYAPDPDALRKQADELERQADALDRQATAVARQTRDALDAEAQATYAALNARATAQALDAMATQQAKSERATATAEVVQATATERAYRATATKQAQDATATATREMATATAVAWAANVQATQHAAQAVAIQATAQAIERREERERMTQPLKTFGPWGLLVLGLAALAWLVVQLLPIVKAKLGTVRRDERGDPPLLLLAQGNVLALLDPTRGWGPATRMEAGSITQPLLTEPEYQDGTTKRAQFVDWRKGGRPRPVIVSQPPARRALPPGDPGQWRDVTPGQCIPQLPTNVPLTSLLDGPPSFRSLALGLTMHEGGRAEVVRAGMGELVHIAVGGSSGWGKSVFLRMLAYQLAVSSDRVDLALVDLEGVTFAPFARCSRLLYPVADSERGALAIFQALTLEMDRRKALYRNFPGVDSLAAYNAQAGEPLSPVVCLVDEATALLADSGVESAIRTLVLRARKFGLWLVLGGQSWKASVLDTTIRDQLASRVQFKAMSASQSRVLLEQSGAEALDVQGRALAIIPGRDLFEMQAPYVSARAITAALSDGGPRHDLPEMAQVESQGDADKVRRVLELHEAGESDTAIARLVFGYGNSFYIDKVRQILQQQQNDSDNNSAEGV
jgi:hypothetical protein